jgi:hypothetical protein
MASISGLLMPYTFHVQKGAPRTTNAENYSGFDLQSPMPTPFLMGYPGTSRIHSRCYWHFIGGVTHPFG